MKILYVISYNNSIDLAWALAEMGHKVVTCDLVLSNHLVTFDKKEKEECIRALTADAYDFVITYNFWPLLSIVCEELGMMYVSWVFDSLLMALFLGEADNSCNRIFVFDKMEYERAKEYGVKNVWYLPMAANCSRLDGLEITDADIAKYGTDISFVGSLYQKRNDYDKIEPELNEERRIKWEKRFGKMLCNFFPNGRNIYEFLDQDDIRFVKECYGNTRNPIGIRDEIFYGFTVLTYELAKRERALLLEKLAERFRVDLYSNQDGSALKGVYVHGPVAYAEEAPKVFYASKINLQHTMPSIETGISQRVYDIMAVGGFVLSNWQEEYETLFEQDRDLVLYYDPDDMMRKAEYYMTHEKERLMIAINGYKKVHAKHTYLMRVEEMLNKIRMQS